MSLDKLTPEKELPKSEVMDFNPEVEDRFIEKAKAGIDRFIAEGGNTVLFDWDGTARGNNFQQGISNYIRRGFVETYKYAREKGLKIGICSLRNIEEIENLEHLGITFDECNGANTMETYIADHPSTFHDGAAALQSLTREELLEKGENIIKEIKAGKRPQGWEIMLQLSGELQAKNPQYSNIKILFIAHRVSEGEKVFLIDDDEMSGSTAEKFGVGVHIPRPAGYKHDKNTLT